MGRGDKRTRKGKIKAASYGNCRSHKKPEPKVQPKLDMKDFEPKETEATAVVVTKVKVDDEGATVTPIEQPQESQTQAESVEQTAEEPAKDASEESKKAKEKSKSKKKKEAAAKPTPSETPATETENKGTDSKPDDSAKTAAPKEEVILQEKAS